MRPKESYLVRRYIRFTAYMPSWKKMRTQQDYCETQLNSISCKHAFHSNIYILKHSVAHCNGLVETYTAVAMGFDVAWMEMSGLE